MGCILSMFLDKKGKFVIIFIAMLILSITPASAVLIGEGYGNVTNTSSQDVLAGELVDDETLKSVDKNSDDLQRIMDVVNGDLDYIQKRSKDYNWKVWKWPKITSEGYLLKELEF